MKQYYISKFTAMLVLAMGFHFTSMAQKITEEKLLGCWKIKSIEFLEPKKDSMELINSTKNIITCFEKNGKFTTNLKKETEVQIVGTGSFSIGPDGKTISQKRDADDDGIDEPGEATMINDNEIAFKVEKLILHYERLPGK